MKLTSILKLESATGDYCTVSKNDLGNLQIGGICIKPDEIESFADKLTEARVLLSTPANLPNVAKLA